MEKENIQLVVLVKKFTYYTFYEFHENFHLIQNHYITDKIYERNLLMITFHNLSNDFVNQALIFHGNANNYYYFINQYYYQKKL